MPDPRFSVADRGRAKWVPPRPRSAAELVAASLTDNVSALLTWYTVSDDDKRWSSKEDQRMISGLPDFPTRPAGESPVRWFQRTRGLTVDGAAGIQTRRALVSDYMAIDGTSLPAGVSLEIHGCGENFPDAEELPGGQDAQDRNRRVELYFFDGHMGVQPPARSKNSQPGSSEYPEWVRRAQETHDFNLLKWTNGRLSCPGDEFPWPELEQRGLARSPATLGVARHKYDDFFSAHPNVSLVINNNDNGSKYGKDGKVRAGAKWQDLIAQLQNDLQSLGYRPAKVLGKYTVFTYRNVERFQVRYFAGSRAGGGYPNGTFDRTTADMLKRALASTP